MLILFIILYAYGAIVMIAVAAEISRRRKPQLPIVGSFYEILVAALLLIVLWPLFIRSARYDWRAGPVK